LLRAGAPTAGFVAANRSFAPENRVDAWRIDALRALRR